MTLKKTLTGQEKGGLAVVTGAIVALILIKLLAKKEGFWIPYSEGFTVSGWMTIFAGILWLAFSAARARTSFFDLNRKLGSDKLGLSMGAIALAVVISLFVVLPRLPATGEADLPADPAIRKQVIRLEKNFRYYTSLAIVCTGLAIGAFPAIRFFRK